MKKQEIKKEIATPKKIKKLEIKGMKQVKGGFVVSDDILGF